jgi:hypothetical protein
MFWRFGDFDHRAWTLPTESFQTLTAEMNYSLKHISSMINHLQQSLSRIAARIFPWTSFKLREQLRGRLDIFGNSIEFASMHFGVKDYAMCSEGYNTGLFDCCTDTDVCCNVCCSELLCGLAQASNWARSRSETCECWHFFAYSSPIWTRANIRKMNNYTKEQPHCRDCCAYSFCGLCAICQDARQLNLIESRLQQKKQPTYHNPHSTDRPQTVVNVYPGQALPPGFFAPDQTIAYGLPPSSACYPVPLYPSYPSVAPPLGIYCGPRSESTPPIHG